MADKKLYQPGEVVLVRNGRLAGIFVVISVDVGDDTVAVARLGGENNYYHAVDRSRLESVNPIPIYQAVGAQLAGQGV